MDNIEEDDIDENDLEGWKKLYIRKHGNPNCKTDEDWQDFFEETRFIQRYRARRQLVATQEFMETEMYRTLSKEGKRFFQNEHDALERTAYCECDGYDSRCYICLQIFRRARYGWDIHNTDCVCNECTYGHHNPFRSDY